MAYRKLAATVSGVPAAPVDFIETVDAQRVEPFRGMLADPAFDPQQPVPGFDAAWAFQVVAWAGTRQMLEMLAERVGQAPDNKSVLEWAIRGDSTGTVVELLDDMLPGRETMEHFLHAIRVRATDVAGLFFVFHGSASYHGRVLIAAARAGNLQIVQHVYRVSPASNYVNDAFLAAVQAGQVDVVRLLLTCEHLYLKYGWRVHGGSLAIAARNGHADIVAILLDIASGSYRVPFQRYKLGKHFLGQALWLAVEGGHTDVVSLLTRSVATDTEINWDALETAQRYGHADVVDIIMTAFGE